jgi:hypothetical protein
MIKMCNGQYKTCQPLGKDELRDIYTLAIKPAWAAKIMEANAELHDLSLTELIEYLEKLEQVDKMRKSMESNNSKPYKGKHKRSKEICSNAKMKQQTGNKEDVEECDTCGKHHCGECWHKNKDNKQGKKFHPGLAGKSSQKTYTMEEIKELSQVSFAMFGSMDASKQSSKKKLEAGNDECDGEINHMLAKMCMNRRNDNDPSESESDAYVYAYPIHHYLPPTKKIKTTHRCSEVVAMMKGSTEPLRVLLDSGTSSCIVLKKHVDRKNLSKYKGKPSHWKTMGGIYTTKCKALVEFTFPEFSTNKTISCVYHVDESADPHLTHYDMIIGDELMKELGIDLIYSTTIPTVQWEEVEVPMKPRHTLSESHVMEQIYYQAFDMASKPLRHAELRRVCILDTDEHTYAQQDLEAFIRSLEHLTRQQQDLLLETLHKRPVLLSGGLGTADVQLVDFELVPDAKPYHIKQPFSIPVVYQGTTKK